MKFNNLKYLKGKSYKIENEELMNKDEYKKFLYINMLCTVVLNGNTPTEGQLTFLNRIICGANCEEGLEVYMRKASDTNDKIFEDFADEYRNSTLKYNFVLEGILLENLGESSNDDYQYLVDIIEVLGLKKVEVDYLSALAKSILMQSSELYKETREILEEGIKGFNFIPYTKNYLSGVLKNTFNEYYACGIDKDEFDIGNTTFENQKVILENLKIKYIEKLTFNGCESVEFINCDLSDTNITIYFKGVGKVKFYGCNIYNINSRFAFLDSCGSLYIKNSTFNNISFKRSSVFNENYISQYYKEEKYAISYYPNGDNIVNNSEHYSSDIFTTTRGTFDSDRFYFLHSAVFRIVGNYINDIYIENISVSNINLINTKNPSGYDEHIVGVFIGATRQTIDKLIVKNSKFYGCVAEGYKGDLKDESVIYCQTPNNYTCENTTVEGGVRFITKFYV